MRSAICLLSLGLFGLPLVHAAPQPVPSAPNGIEFPSDYPDWRLISISDRTDNKTLRAILGNDIAIEAARAGRTDPWPDGAVLGKVVWKAVPKTNWKAALAPGKFVHAEFMFKDAQKWAGNGTGWGWARWVGTDQTPYGKDATFSQECISCHTPVKDTDWVFTVPARFPAASR